MNNKIENIKNFRRYLLQQLDTLTTGQMNTIPAGYSNNLIWNLGHLICVQQNLCYVRAGLPIAVDDKYFSPYMPGSIPERIMDEHEITRIKEVFITSIDQLKTDFDKSIFGNYSPAAMIKKVYRVEVSNIEEAIDYLLYHQGFHAGYILSLKHLV
jgi:hypothetical protein